MTSATAEVEYVGRAGVSTQRGAERVPKDRGTRKVVLSAHGESTTDRRSRLTAADIMAMDEQTFSERMRRTGMEAKVRDALSRLPEASA